jgi:hypothetical protein
MRLARGYRGDADALRRGDINHPTTGKNTPTLILKADTLSYATAQAFRPFALHWDNRMARACPPRTNRGHHSIHRPPTLTRGDSRTVPQLVDSGDFTSPGQTKKHLLSSDASLGKYQIDLYCF